MRKQESGPFSAAVCKQEEKKYAVSAVLNVCVCSLLTVLGTQRSNYRGALGVLFVALVFGLSWLFGFCFI